MIQGLAVEIGPEAVVICAELPLRALSSAVVGGGLAQARAIVNLHVPKDDPCADPGAMVADFARRAAVPEPYVGLLTSAWTEQATVGEASGGGFAAVAVTTVGLSNRIAAGRSATLGWAPSTINTIVIVEADPEPAALVNAVITVTEVKALLLMEGGIRDGDGGPATGTSTDAVVIAATGRGPRARFGGPASPLGWVIARAARQALGEGVRGWRERNP
ncbi:MAG: adenosylcobinamide amidohydrolase [Candidatus Rokubacteria bacterium]|nr:adenosylcobinamide amidohydrolase [Candidatus Rokubacteria bacterium]